MKNDIFQTELTDAELQLVTGGNNIFGGGAAGSTFGTGAFQTSSSYGTVGSTNDTSPLTGYVASGATSNYSTASTGGTVYAWGGPPAFI